MDRYDSFLFTSQGGREYNEDAVGEKVFSSSVLFLLADGLGGHQKGEIASSCVVGAMEKALEPKENEDISQWVTDRIKEANAALLALRESTHWNMKSTLVALHIGEKKACWAHVGDSRLYFFHNDRLAEVTRDHSVAYAKYKNGEISRAQIGKDEDQSSLLRVLGNPERNHPDLGETLEPLQPGDGFLLCSDGLWEYLYDGEILADFLKTETAEEWGELLLLRVMERVEPGNDNLSLITVRIL